MNFQASTVKFMTSHGPSKEMATLSYWCPMGLTKPSCMMQIGSNFSNSIHSHKYSTSQLTLGLKEDIKLNTATRETAFSSLTHSAWFTITNTYMTLQCLIGNSKTTIWQTSMILICTLEITDMLMSNECNHLILIY